MITIHNIPNYGSVFQAMALNQYLLRLGHDCRVMDYNPPYFTKGSLRARLGRLLNYKSHAKRTKKYRQFVEANMKLTDRSFSSLEQLKAHNWDAVDLFMAGGDQLWNEFYDCGQDDAYKLTFTDKPKVAFGTSLGKRTFSRQGMEKLISAVSGFRQIGIREKSGTQLLTDAGLSQSVHVCDPVFLLDKEDYQRFIHPVPIKERYMFVYLVQQSPLLDYAVKHISEKLGLKVVLYVGTVPKCHYDYLCRDLGPDETLSYVANADFILSASFHASAFSVIFRKPFITLLPGENTNARIEDFLSLLETEERVVCSREQLEAALDTPINWDKINTVMDSHIRKSKQFLSDALTGDTGIEGYDQNN